MTATPAQLAFFDKMPGAHWVVIVEKPRHKVFKPGTLFLVIESQGEFLLCWKNGIPPQGWSKHRGTLINKRYTSPIVGWHGCGQP